MAQLVLKELEERILLKSDLRHDQVIETGLEILADADAPREGLDLFLAADPKAPTLAFIHGG